MSTMPPTDKKNFASIHSCALCRSDARISEIIDGYPYYLCDACRFLFMPDYLSKVDYGEAYWKNEYEEAVRRENEDCFMRALELIYLSKIPVRKMLDFGCGLGITVNRLRSQFGMDAIGIDKYGKFEPGPYLLKEDILTTNKLKKEDFDAIMSVEVVEHLPQQTILPIFESLKALLKPGGLLLINTGTLEFTEESPENKGYIDPAVRGHISVFSGRTFKKIADMLGLIHIPLWSRTWCTLFLKPKKGVDPSVRAWAYIEENADVIRRIGPMYRLVKKSLWAEEFHSIMRRFGVVLPKGIRGYARNMLFRTLRRGNT